MSEKENICRAMEVFWTRDDPADSDGPVVRVTGLQDAGNHRPKKQKRVKGRKTREVKANIPVKQPVVENLTPQKNSQSGHVLQQMNGQPRESTRRDSQKPSLKDLRAEDKQRVANLVRELARLGQEKETVAQQLERERGDYDQQVRHFTQQQQDILLERRDVQKQLLECQTLLARYQNHVLEQQEKLNESFTESHAHKKQTVDEAKYTPQPGQHTNLHLEGTPALVHTEPPPVQLPGVPTHPLYSTTPGASRHLQQYTHPDWNSWPILKTLQSQYEPMIMAGQQPHYEHPTTGRLPHFEHPTTGKLPHFEHPFPEWQPHVEQPVSGQRPVTDDMPRPFTNMIDKLIAEEKRKTPTGSRSASFREKELRGIGPLSEPIMSSTQRSNLEQDAGQSSEFKPLQCDSSPSSCSLPARVTFEVKSRLPKPNLDKLNDEDFVNYLKTLDQDERKRHLLHQREALMQEQRQLQKILLEQESLLLAKQTQLHQQQALQRRRLAYFEHTGHFPPPDWDGAVPAPQRLGPQAPMMQSASTSPSRPQASRTTVGTSPMRHPSHSVAIQASPRHSRQQGGGHESAATGMPAHQFGKQGNMASAVLYEPKQHHGLDFLQDGRADALLHIVDEVESMHSLDNSSPSPYKAHQHTHSIGRHHHGDRQVYHGNTIMQALDDNEDAEESRVLEEVFFVK